MQARSREHELLLGCGALLKNLLAFSLRLLKLSL
jgi:hypothetical protein